MLAWAEDTAPFARQFLYELLAMSVPPAAAVEKVEKKVCSLLDSVIGD
jgi:hypothetical protein